MQQFTDILRSKFFDVFLILGLAISIRVPAFFLEREPYLFCDESIYAGEAMRMLSENSWVTTEFRAGGFNIYAILVSLFVAQKVGLFPNLIDLYDISRLVETVALGSATSIFIYLTALKIYEKRSAGLIAGLVFVLAPGSIAYSRFAYPDHYVYFFSSAVLFYLICFLKDPTKNRHLAAVGLFTGMAMSVKYSAAFLVIPVFVAIVTGRCLSTQFCVRDFAKNLAITGTSALAALFLFNFSAFVNPEEFVSGFFFNVENYSSSTGTLISGITYYAIVAVVIFFGASTFPLWIIGIWRIIKEKQIFFGTLISFPLALIAYLGSLGLVLNRNMSILIPFVVIPITGGIIYIFSRDFECESSAKRLIKVIATCAIVLSIAQASYGLVKDLKADSRVVANEWIKQNLQGIEAAGMNEFCSGQSPAIGVLPQVIYDPFMELNLPVYVFNSYWTSPLSPSYRESKPFWQELEQKQIHFYHFGDRDLLKNSERSKNLEDFVPKDYKVVKRISEAGPEVVILIRSDLLAEDLKK